MPKTIKFKYSDGNIELFKGRAAEGAVASPETNGGFHTNTHPRCHWNPRLYVLHVQSAPSFHEAGKAHRPSLEHGVASHMPTTHHLSTQSTRLSTYPLLPHLLYPAASVWPSLVSTDARDGGVHLQQGALSW